MKTVVYFDAPPDEWRIVFYWPGGTPITYHVRAKHRDAVEDIAAKMKPIFEKALDELAKIAKNTFVAVPMYED